MSNTSKIQHAQTLMFSHEISDLRRLTGQDNTKDALSEAVEAFLELRPVKKDGRWIVMGIFPNRFKK